MIDVRPFGGLGHGDHGWLNARHHFSFANYHDPARMGWGAIRVWNDDTIAAHTGFDPHPHRDMEIITFIRTGAISLGLAIIGISIYIWIRFEWQWLGSTTSLQLMNGLLVLSDNLFSLSFGEKTSSVTF